MEGQRNMVESGRYSVALFDRGRHELSYTPTLPELLEREQESASTDLADLLPDRSENLEWAGTLRSRPLGRLPAHEEQSAMLLRQAGFYFIFCRWNWLGSHKATWEELARYMAKWLVIAPLIADRWNELPLRVWTPISKL